MGRKLLQADGLPTAIPTTAGTWPTAGPIKGRCVPFRRLWQVLSTRGLL